MHDTLARWGVAIHDLNQIERIFHKFGITAQTSSEHAPDEGLEEGVIFDHQSTKGSLTLFWRLSVQKIPPEEALRYVRVRVGLEKQGDDDNGFVWGLERNYENPAWILCPLGKAELVPLDPEIDKELAEIQNIYRQDFGIWEFHPEPDVAMSIILSFARIFAAAT